MPAVRCLAAWQGTVNLCYIAGRTTPANSLGIYLSALLSVGHWRQSASAPPKGRIGAKGQIGASTTTALSLHAAMPRTEQRSERALARAAGEKENARRRAVCKTLAGRQGLFASRALAVVERARARDARRLRRGLRVQGQNRCKAHRTRSERPRAAARRRALRRDARIIRARLEDAACASLCKDTADAAAQFIRARRASAAAVEGWPRQH